MNYPLISEYIEAIKAAEENFEQLKNLRPVLDGNGEPMFSSGNFAVVFKMKDEQTGKLHALKCFLKEQEGRAEAYRLIAEELEYVSSTFLTPIKYLDKELFVDTGQTTETEFPVLLMDWVEGQTLDKYIREHIDDQYELSLLAYQFSRLAMWLIPQPFAHGDLKPDNILVKEDGTLVLVDYDGMYVPAMKGQKARELGSPDFCHPGRTEDDFDEHIDDFSLVSILLSLKAIALQPELLERYGASDRLLFSERDYRNLSGSQVMDAIKTMIQDSELATLYSLFILSSAQNNLSQASFRLFNLCRPQMQEPENLSTEVTEEDLANAWVDEYGVKYSADKKRLLLVPDIITEYRIRKGTRIICDKAFGKPNLVGKRKHNIKTLYIPDSVSIIGSESLYGCLHLYEIVVSKKNRIYDSRDNCNAIIRTENNELLFGCQATVIPNNVSTISINAFLSCSNLKSINIPDSVISIGEQAFMNCGQLKEIYIPASIKEIGDRALNGCDIERVIIDKANSIYDSRDNCNAIILTKENRLIFGCKKTIIPKSVTEIGENSFECCDLKTIGIPINVKKIWRGAFMACSDLQSIIFSSSFLSIGDYAFSCCTNLTTISFSSSVKNIGINAFGGCNKITKIYIPKGTMVIFEQLMPEYKDKLVEQDVERNLGTEATEDDLADAWTDEFGVMYSADRKKLLRAPIDIEEYTVKDGTKIICDKAFAEITYNEEYWSPTFWGYGSYNERERIQTNRICTLIIPDSVVKIGFGAFQNCVDLKSIVIPNSVRVIGDNTFYCCENLSKISISNNLETIGAGVFNGCNISSIIIPDNVKSIGCKAFANCDNLTHIVIPDGLTFIGDSAFSFSSIQTAVIPDSVTFIGRNAFRFCSVTSIKLSHNLKSLNAFCFDSTQLHEIIIPEGIKEIESHAFSCCLDLSKVYLPKSVHTIGESAFYNCPSLQNIFIPKGTKQQFEALLHEYKEKLVELNSNQ